MALLKFQIPAYTCTYIVKLTDKARDYLSLVLKLTKDGCGITSDCKFDYDSLFFNSDPIVDEMRSAIAGSVWKKEMVHFLGSVHKTTVRVD